MSKSRLDGVERKYSVPSKTTGTGAIDDDVFRAAFVPPKSVTAYSSKELLDHFNRIKANLSVDPEEWEKRTDAMITLRALVASGSLQFDEFLPQLKSLESLINGCLSDLRSSVIREACITVAYLSTELQNRFDRFAEAILQTLIALMSNTVKIMSSCGIIAMRFILENTHSARIIPILLSSMTAKSNVTRKYICDFMEILFRAWPVNILEKHIGLLQDNLKRGMYDADADARKFSRRAFPLFANKFPDQSNSLLQSLDAQKRKLLEKDLITAGLSGSTTLVRSESQSVASRPTKPVLGTSAINSTRRPPVTNQNESMARYWRQQSANSNTTNRGRGFVSQSQPTSRETSPTRRAYGILGHGQTYNAAGYLNRNGPNDKRSTYAGLSNTTSRVPRSQGPSRDISPARSVTGGSYTSSTFYRTPNGASLRDRTKGGIADYGGSSDLPHGGGRQPFGSDDNFSETSSQCSDRSGRSNSAYRKQSSVQLTNNLKEIYTQLSGSQWSSRKDGLINIQNYLRSGNGLSPEELRRLTELFSKMFADSHGKVVPLFMDTLQYFIKEYNPMLHEWLYILLLRLLNRLGSEALGSHQKAIQETLCVLRSHFPLPLQFNTCCRFVMDNTQAPSMKVKVCLLEYLKDLILMMSPDALSSTPTEVNLAISRMISWSAEPKSADVRRMASRVVIKLHDLNPTSFATIQQSLPSAIQNRASEVLLAYQKTTAAGGMMVDGGNGHSGWRTSLSRCGSLRKQSFPLSTRDYMTRSVEQRSQISRGQSVPTESDGLSSDHMNSMIRQTTEGLRNLTMGTTQPPMHRRVSAESANSSYQEQLTGSQLNGTGVLRTMQPSNVLRSPSPSHVNHLYDPNAYPAGDPMLPLNRLDNVSVFEHGDGPKVKKPVIGYQTLKKIREMPPEDIMAEILQELSNHNERHEQRNACMLKLMKLLRENIICNWDEYFKPTLLILLETLGDNSPDTRALALKVLQELVRAKSDLFHEFAYLFVIKVLDACRDDEKTVRRAAEDCAKMVAQCLPPDLCFSVLTPLINDRNLNINLPAIKMQEQVVRSASQDMVMDVLDVIIPGLIVAYNHEESAMRKASVFCLVAIAIKVGDVIWETLSDLQVGKKRLLQLYIDREIGGYNAAEPKSAGVQL